jgi:hypothetical protein
MKISELVSEQTIGTTGSTTGTPGQVGQVSQTSAPSTGNAPTAANKATTDPNMIQLGKILNQAGIKDPAAATKAAAALQKTIKTPNNPNLSDEEKKLLAPITADLITDPATSTAIKAIAKQRPAPIGQQPTTPPPMGATPPPTIK